MKFQYRRAAERELANDDGMRRFLQRVADDAADAADRHLPERFFHGGRRPEITGETKKEPAGWEGEVRAEGSFWHWGEFGTSRMRATPYLRPGVNETINRYGGRLGSEGD